MALKPLVCINSYPISPTIVQYLPLKRPDSMVNAPLASHEFTP